MNHKIEMELIEMINRASAGMPMTVVVPRLMLTILALLEELEIQGLDVRVVLGDILAKWDGGAPIPEHDESVHEERRADLGPCCACEKSGPTVRNVIMLDKRAPIAGTGWGCVQCGLAADGAVAVLCDDCLGSEPKSVCRGSPGENMRVSVLTLAPEPFAHDLRKHEEIPWR